MRSNNSSTKDENFRRRLDETMGTETDPEMYTPNTAGCEETEGRSIFPLVDQFNQTNMLDRPRRGRSNGNNTGLGKDQS